MTRWRPILPIDFGPEFRARRRRRQHAITFAQHLALSAAVAGICWLVWQAVLL